METYTISDDKRTLSIQGHSISFRDDIETVLTFPDIWVVQLGNVRYKNGQPAINMPEQPINNVYGVDKKCNIIWSIKEIATLHIGSPPDEYYSGATKISDSAFRIYAFRGYSLSIDVNTLEVVNKKFVK